MTTPSTSHMLKAQHGEPHAEDHLCSAITTVLHALRTSAGGSRGLMGVYNGTFLFRWCVVLIIIRTLGSSQKCPIGWRKLILG